MSDLTDSIFNDLDAANRLRYGHNVTPEAAQHIRPLEIQTEELPDDSDDLVLPIVPVRAADVRIPVEMSGLTVREQLGDAAYKKWQASYGSPSKAVWWLFAAVCLILPSAALLFVLYLMVVNS